MSRMQRYQWNAANRRTSDPPQYRPHRGRCALDRRLGIEQLEDRRLLAILVNTLVDENDGIGAGGVSLRDAIAAAAVDEVIEFDPALTSSGPVTITLTQGELAVTRAMTIAGPGADLLVIDASGNDFSSASGDGSRVFTIDDFSFEFSVVSISGLTLTGGDSSSAGGAIFSAEILNLADTTISGNTTSFRGGGIASYFAPLNVTGSTISGNSSSFFEGGGVAVYAGGLSIADSTISGNTAGSGAGGGVSFRGSYFNYGGYSATIVRSTISGNVASGDGGGIDARFGSLSVADSDVSNNTAASGSGGGVAFYATPFSFSAIGATITGSTISGNSAGVSGGGVNSRYGNLSIADSVLSSNAAGQNGGGVAFHGSFNFSNQRAFAISASTVSYNSAGGNGGGVSSTAGPLTISASSIRGNFAARGGGIDNAAADVTITGSTLSGNSTNSGNGGGISSRGGDATLVNSTVSGNSAVGSGAGLYLRGYADESFAVRHSTITANNAGAFGGGVFFALGELSLDHAILAGNSALFGPDATTLHGGVIDARYSLLGDNAGLPLGEAPLGSPDANGNLVGGPVGGAISPLLGSLSDNGGPLLPDGAHLQSHALLAGSPAIDAGDPAPAVAPLFDQRGAPFVRTADGDNVGGARIDIGAVERQSLALLVDTLADEDDGDYSSGDFSLREALYLANGNIALDVIDFAPHLAGGTIFLSMGELLVTDDVAVNGLGDELLAIDAGGASRVFHVNLVNGGAATIAGLTITGGNAWLGGGILFSGAFQTSLLAINDSTITGNAAAGDGGGVYSGYGFGLGGSVTINGSIISHNTASGSGGGVAIRYGSLSIAHSTITGNSAAFYGGGVKASYAYPNVTVSHSTLSGNSAHSGGAIWNRGAGLTLTGSTISGNTAVDRGAGVYGQFASLSVADSTLTGNEAGGAGGAIYTGSAAIAVNSSTISGNSANIGGGVYASGFITVSDSNINDNAADGAGGGVWSFGADVAHSTISGNTAGGDGGGIFTRYDYLAIARSTIAGNDAGGSGGGVFNRFGTAAIDASAFSGNSAATGGGLWSRGALTLTSSTISGNSATGAGGGAYLFGDAYSSQVVRHSTIAFNSAESFGGGFTLVGGPVELDHTIIAQNSAAFAPDLANLFGAVAAAFSLVGNSAGSTLAESPAGVADAAGNRIGGPVSGLIDPLLAPLADNGGPTFTHALLVGSAALNAGDPLAAVNVNVPEFDQRGAPFVRVSGRIDMGAYERQSLLPGFLVVDTLTDVVDGDYSTGQFSLREAINLARGSIGHDLVAFAPELTAGGPAVIILNHGELVIDDSLTLTGPGAGLLTVDASGSDPTPNDDFGDGSRIFLIDNLSTAFASVAISGLALTGGDVASSGGAIFNREHLSLTDVAVRNNSARNTGGGIHHFGPASLNIAHSEITGNSLPTFGRRGGGIYATGPATIADSTISGNSSSGYGGGIFAASNLTLERSTVSGNSAFYAAGGVYSNATGSRNPLLIFDSRIVDNVASFDGGGVFKIRGVATIVRSVISGNAVTDAFNARGGGLIVRYGSLNLTDSTVSGNSARTGGGIWTDGNLAGSETTQIVGSTISGNTAAFRGGGIYNIDGRTNVRFSTITANYASPGGGGGIATWGDNNTRTSLLSTIVAGNVNGDVDVFNFSVNPYLTSGFNLVGVGNALAAFTHPADQTGVLDPLLAPLADNGGPTMTHALLPGSLAIDAGDPAATPGVSGVPMFDQRGAPFSRLGGGAVDVGAYESAPPPIAADFDEDGDADGNDFLMWQRGVGTPLAQHAHGDADGDLDVDGIDLAVWEGSFGDADGGAITGALALAVLSEPVASADLAAASSPAARPAGDVENAASDAALAGIAQRALSVAAPPPVKRWSVRASLLDHAERLVAAPRSSLVEPASPSERARPRQADAASPRDRAADAPLKTSVRDAALESLHLNPWQD